MRAAVLNCTDGRVLAGEASFACIAEGVDSPSTTPQARRAELNLAALGLEDLRGELVCLRVKASAATLFAIEL